MHEESGVSYECKIRQGAGVWRSLLALRKKIQSADLVHALDAYPYAVFAAFSRAGLKTPFLITAVGTGAIAGFHRPYSSAILRWAYRKADQIIAISNFSADTIRTHLPKCRVEIINPGVDLEVFSGRSNIPLSERIQALQPYLLSVGSLRWRKGYHRSIPAFAKIRESFPALHYVIIGKRYQGVYYNRLKDLIRQYGLEGRVHLMTEVDSWKELADFYQGAELFGLLSQTKNHDMEGFGLVFLEAAASGLPIIGTRGSGISDAVREGKNAFLVSPIDADHFAEAAAEILGSKEKRREMSEASLRWARQCGWEKQLEKYRFVYGELLNRSV